MAPSRDPAVDALLAEARAQFASSLPDKASALRHRVERGEWDDARRAAHKLRGSGATYGFAAVGEAAAAIEELLTLAAQAGDVRSLARLEPLLDRLRVEADRAAGGHQ